MQDREVQEIGEHRRERSSVLGLGYRKQAERKQVKISKKREHKKRCSKNQECPLGCGAPLSVVPMLVVAIPLSGFIGIMAIGAGAAGGISAYIFQSTDSSIATDAGVNAKLRAVSRTCWKIASILSHLLSRVSTACASICCCRATASLYVGEVGWA